MKIKSIFIIFAISILSYLVFFYPMLNKNTIIYSGKDTTTLHLQSRIYLYEKLKEGKYPFWTERMFGGYPIYADLERGFLNPLNVSLIYLFGPFTSYKIIHFVFYLLGSFSLYLFLKRYGVNLLGYSIANIIYFFSFFHIYHQQHLNMILSTYLLPLVLYLIQKYIEERKIRYIFLNSLVLANCFYLGSFQMTLIITFISFIYLLIFNRLGKNTTNLINLKENLIYLLFFLVSFIILVSPGLCAQFDLYKYSFRANEFVFNQGSYSPLMIINIFFPFVFNFADKYMGTIINTNYFMHETYSYVGISSLLLSIFGYISLKNKENTKDKKDKKKNVDKKDIRNLRMFLIFLVWFFLVFAFIKNIPILRNANFLPFSLFRYWIRSSFLISFAVAVLSPIFISDLTKLERITIKDFKFLLPVIIYLSFLEIINFKQTEIISIFKLISRSDYSFGYHYILWGIVLILSVLCIYLRRIKYINYVLVGVVFLDIIFFGKLAFNNSFININTGLLNIHKSKDLENSRILDLSGEITGDNVLLYTSWSPLGYAVLYPKSLDSDLREINLVSPRYIKSDKALDFYDDNFHKNLEKIGISSVILPDKKIKKLEGDTFIPGEYEITNIVKEEGYINAYISAINQTNIDTTLRYYPGWILKKTDMYRNEITQRGSFISFNMDPGSVDVKLTYTPVSLYTGARLSAILFIIFSWLYYFLKRNVLKDVKF